MPSSKPLPPVGRGRKPGTKLGFKPQTEHEKARRVHVPPPVTAEGKAEREAQQTARVELLMLRGVTTPRLIGSMLGIETEREVNRYIGLVHSRWSVTGSGRDVQRARGEALARYAMLETSIWEKLSDNGDLKPSDRTAMIKVLLEIQSQREAVSGLAPRVIERMALMPQADDGIASRMQAQASLQTVANRFLEIIASRREKLGLPRTIDHDAGDDLDFSDDAEITAH